LKKNIPSLFSSNLTFRLNQESKTISLECIGGEDIPEALEQFADVLTETFTQISDADMDNQTLSFTMKTTLSANHLFQLLHKDCQFGSKAPLTIIASKEFTRGNKLGAGSYANVYQGTWKQQQVALKKIKNDTFDKDDFFKEAKIMASCQHDNIVRLVGIWQDDSDGFVLELCQGSLYSALYTDETITLETPWQNKLSLLEGMAKGLHYLHTQTPLILHRDLKSPNVLLKQEDNQTVAKLADFGLAKFKESVSKIQSLVGTMTWMAPELFEIELHYCPKADIFSYGLIITEVANIQLPCKNLGPQQVMIKRTNEKYDPGETFNENTPEAIKNLGLFCCKRKPEDRADSQKLLEEISGISRQCSQDSGPPHLNF